MTRDDPPGLTIPKSKIAEAFNDSPLIFLGVSDYESDKNSFARYQDWLNKRLNADMQFMEKNLGFRRNPNELLPASQTIISFALNYKVQESRLSSKSSPRIAMYARYRDYHKVMRKTASNVIQRISPENAADRNRWRVCIDSAPILERAVAAKTSLGFIGKNTCYIHPKKGSFLLLGEILTVNRVEADTPSKVDAKKRTTLGGCGTCTRCQSFCPTGALDKAYVLDANKCLSYWTIENRGVIPKEYWVHVAKYIFGCDICQSVCPYNRKTETSKISTKIQGEVDDLFAVATMDQKFYEDTFGGTPMTRAKRHGLIRNALIAMAVKNHPELDKAIDYLRKKESHSEMLMATIGQIDEE